MIEIIFEGCLAANSISEVKRIRRKQEKDASLKPKTNGLLSTNYTLISFLLPAIIELVSVSPSRMINSILSLPGSQTISYR